MSLLIDDTAFAALKTRVAQLAAQPIRRHTGDGGFTCNEPARARTRNQVSKRRLFCAACARRLTDDLIFEYLSPTGKRLVYCSREDCAAL